MATEEPPAGRCCRADTSLSQTPNSGRSAGRLVPGRPSPPSTGGRVKTPSPLSRSISFSPDADVVGDVGLASPLRHEYSAGSIACASSRELWHQRAQADEITTQNIAEKYEITAGEGILLYSHQRENGDEFRRPNNEKEARSCNILTRRGLVEIGSLMFIASGLLAMLIGYPIM